MWSQISLVLLAFGVASSSPLSDVHAAAQIGEQVETTSGPVKGHEAEWPKNSGVSEYLAIPFAEPPTGPLRFAAPQKYKTRGPISGEEFGPGCLQFVDMGAATKETGANGGKRSTFNATDDHLLAYGSGMGGDMAKRYYSEDCLALNVWTKPGSKGKAVLVWLYGGAFASGDTAGLYYNGARLAAEQDVVVASINYRVSLFGFPGAPTLPDQNVGLLDQRLAVEWLRDNIEKFGGDPKRMTLFGESAGGAAVDYYSYAWTKDPIINAFIPQSGSASIRPSQTKSVNDSNWYKLTAKLGCGNSEDGAKTVDCMRNVPHKTIQKYLIDWSTATSNPLSLMTQFGPIPDGKIVFSDYPKRQAEGNFIKRPMLIGNMDQEGALFPGMMLAAVKNIGKAKGGALSKPIDALLSWMEKSQNSRPKPAAAAPGPFDRISCGPAVGATARSKAGVPAWRYRWFGEWPNLEIYPGIGAYHSMDCPIVFGATERTSKIADTPEEAKFVKNIMTAWATFAKDPDHGLEKLGWPKYDPSKPTLVRLGYKNNATVSFADPTEYDKACQS